MIGLRALRFALGEPVVTGRTRVRPLRRLFSNPLLIVEVELRQEIEFRTVAQAKGEGRQATETWWRPLEADDLQGRFLTLAQGTTLRPGSGQALGEAP